MKPLQIVRPYDGAHQDKIGPNGSIKPKSIIYKPLQIKT